MCISFIRTWISDYVRFSPGGLFISGLISSNSFCQIAFQAFLIWYIEEIWKDPSIRWAAVIVNVFDGIVFFLSIVGNHIAVDRIGQFRLIIFTVPFFIMGLLMLWLCKLLLSPGWRNQLLYLGLCLITIGLAGQDASIGPFLFDQFVLQEDGNNRLPEYLAEGRAAFWQMAAKGVGSFTCWAFASSLNWNPTFMVTFIWVTVAYIIFWCGDCPRKRYYRHEDPTNKRAASRMMQAKGLLKLIPLWLTFIPYSLADATGDTFFIVQSYRLDQSVNPRIALGSFNRIPITSLYLFQSLISAITSMLSSFLIRKFWSCENTMQQYSRVGFVRIGIGMLFASGSCLSAWRVEVRILNLINELGITEFETIPMKILWLAPEFGLLGIANGLAGKGMERFFHDRLPQPMKFFAFPLAQGVFVVGRFISVISILLARDWIRDDQNESHLDKYFLTLTILNITFLLVYAILSSVFVWRITDADEEAGMPMEEVNGRAGDL